MVLIQEKLANTHLPLDLNQFHQFQLFKNNYVKIFQVINIKKIKILDKIFKNKGLKMTNKVKEEIIYYKNNLMLDNQKQILNSFKIQLTINRPILLINLVNIKINQNNFSKL